MKVWFAGGRVFAAALWLCCACSSEPGSVAGGDGGASADGGALVDGGAAASADGGGVDREWAHWPLREQPIYTTTADTVTDTGTGLVWERAVLSATFNWQEAVGHCAGLGSARFAGFDDWRLPAEIELISILDVTLPGSWLDRVAFPHTPVDQLYWSSSARAGVASKRWGARYATVISADATEAQQVRCVRGGTSAAGEHYTASTDTVLDRWTGLTWQRVAPFTAKGWGESVSYCRALSLGGFATGWRLPTYKELLSLVAWRSAGPAYDPLFPAAPTAMVWSASSFADQATMAWSVDFSSGAGIAVPQVSQSGIRCVR